MAKVLDFVRNLIKFHKLKFVASVLFTIVFLAVLFPFGDLVDLLSQKVAEQTQNQVYVQADDLGITLSPGPGLRLSKVSIDTPTLPTIAVDELKAAPQILALLKGSLGVTVETRGLFNGHFLVDISDGDKTKGGERQKRLELSADGVSLASIASFLHDLNGSDAKFTGDLSLKSSASVDPKYVEQPKGQLGLALKSFNMPSRIADFGMGPLSLPEVAFSKVNIKGGISDGKISLDELSFGDEKDEINGKLKGNLGVTLRGQGTPTAADFGAYDLAVDMNVSSDFQNRAKLFLLILDNYKVATPTGYKYSFKASAANFNSPPKFTN